MRVIKRRNAHLRSFTPVDIYAPKVYYKVKCPGCRSKLEFQRRDLKMEIRKELRKILSFSVNFGYRYEETPYTVPLDCQTAPDGHSFTGEHVYILSAKCPVCDREVASVKKTFYTSTFSKEQIMESIFLSDSAYFDPLIACRKLTLSEKIALGKKKRRSNRSSYEDDDYDSGDIVDDDDDGIDVIFVEVSSDDDDDSDDDDEGDYGYDDE